MRVLLIFPPFSQEEMFSSPLAAVGGHHLPLGLYYLSAMLTRNGHKVQVLDAAGYSLSAQAVYEKALAFTPDILGISATTPTFHRAVELAQLFREKMPHIPRVLGGPHVTATPQSAMVDGLFSIGVIGEGEVTLLELANALEQDRDWRRLPGLAYKTGAEVTLTPPRPLIPDLDTLPLPDYARVQDFSRYAPGVFAHKTLPVAGVITSRGCPNRCTFCDRSVFGQKLRQRSPENIAEEIILLYHKHGIREFNFLDDTFTINGAKRFPPLFSLLKQEGIRFPWSCSTRINAVDENLLRFMKEHGCWYISFGIESGDADILKRIQKNLNMEQARQVLGACRRLGITTKGFFIVGHPGETKESIERSMQFALSLPLDQVGVFINTPLPGTEQFDTASRYGSLAPTDWRMYNMHNPVFVPTGLTEECLTESRRLFMRRFFVRPGTILRFSKLFWGKGGVTRLLSVVRALPFLFFPQRVDGKTA